MAEALIYVRGLIQYILTCFALWMKSSQNRQNILFPNRMWFTSISICDERSERRRPKTWLLLTRSDCHADYSASDRRPIHAYAFVGTRLREESEREAGGPGEAATAAATAAASLTERALAAQATSAAAGGHLYSVSPPGYLTAG